MNYQVLSQNFQTLVNYLVLRASFESVGHFYYPYFLGDPVKDYLLSLQTLMDYGVYQEHEQELRQRGLRLLAFLNSNREAGVRANDRKMDIALQDADKANSEAAMIVRMFINNPDNPAFTEDNLYLWEHYLREKPHWLERDNGKRRVIGILTIKLLEQGKSRNRQAIKTWQRDRIQIDTDPFERVTYQFPLVKGKSNLPVVITGLDFQGFECQIGLDTGKRFQNSGDIRLVFNNVFTPDRKKITATAHDVHTGKFTANWSAKFIGSAL